jgi:ketosteroid isomerase-like protein
MKFPPRRVVLAGVALALSACAHAPATDEAAVSLAAAESAFAAHSVRADMRVAFLAHFAEDGVFVRNGWIPSNAFLRERSAPAIVLDWRPVFTEVAASGEMGLSTGPTRYTGKARPNETASFGQYVSIWRRSDAGPWKVEADLGISHPGAHLWQEALVAQRAPEVRGTSAESLQQAEARFSRESAERGVRSAVAAHAAATMRYYRPGLPPAVGLAAVLQSQALGEERLVWIAERVETARSQDFGYARGRYESPAAPGVARGWYLRAWHREADGWRIAMDVANPAAPR